MGPCPPTSLIFRPKWPTSWPPRLCPMAWIWFGVCQTIGECFGIWCGVGQTIGDAMELGVVVCGAATGDCPCCSKRRAKVDQSNYPEKFILRGDVWFKIFGITRGLGVLREANWKCGTRFANLLGGTINIAYLQRDHPHEDFKTRCAVSRIGWCGSFVHVTPYYL